MISIARVLICLSLALAALAFPGDAWATRSSGQRQLRACTRPGQLLSTCDCKSEYFAKDADQKRCVCNALAGYNLRNGRCVRGGGTPLRACTRPGQPLTTCDCKSEYFMKDADQKYCVCNTRAGYVQRSGRCVRESQRSSRSRGS
jgi:hypothetical protein